MKMILKPKNAELIGCEINNLPISPSAHEMGEDFLLTAKTHNGHDLWKEIEIAVSEKDILQLREQLQDLLSEEKSGEKSKISAFDLADDLDVAKFLEETPDELAHELDICEPLPKIHIHHHHRAVSENTHHFYLEQNNNLQAHAENFQDSENDPEWLLMEEALKENDVMELRESLQQIGRSVPSHNYSVEEIERYLDGEMNPSEYIDFEAELDVNPELNKDIEIHSTLMEAISETDIMDLREQLSKVMLSQDSTSVSLAEIEEFLDDGLTEEERNVFISELNENDDLKAEVNLVRGLDKALSEKDIISLRTELHQISREISRQNVNSMLPVSNRRSKFGRIGTYAAIFVFLVGLSALTWFVNGSRQSTYDQFFNTPQAVSAFRSVENTADADLKKGFESYNKADYAAAVTSFNGVFQNDGANPAAHFYAGASYQNMHRYREALLQYQYVIDHHDNLFVEQAEWLRALCFLGESEKKSAILQLQAVIERKGFYKKDALSLLSKLKENDD